MFQKLSAMLVSTIFLVAPLKAQIQWRDSLETARAESRATGKPILVHFFGDNCPPCHRLEQNAYQNGELIESVNANLIPIRINATQNRSLAQEFAVASWPQDVYLHPNGEVAYRGVCNQDPSVYSTLVQRVALKNRDWVIAFNASKQLGREPSELSPQQFSAAQQIASQQTDSSRMQPQSVAPPSTRNLLVQTPSDATPSTPNFGASPNQMTASGQPNGALANPSPFRSPIEGQPAAIANPYSNTVASAQAPPNGQVLPTQMPLSANTGRDSQISTVAHSSGASLAANASNPAVFAPPSQAGFPKSDKSLEASGTFEKHSSGHPGIGSPTNQQLVRSGPTSANRYSADQVQYSDRFPSANTQSNESPFRSASAQLPVKPSLEDASQNSPNVQTLGAHQNLGGVQNSATVQPIKDELCLSGYCPAAMKAGSLVEGSDQFAVRHRGRIYYCSSDEARQQVLSAPDAYTPVLSGYDVVTFLESGKLDSGNTDLHSQPLGCFIGDQLFLFASEENKARFVASQEGYLQQLEMLKQPADAGRVAAQPSDSLTR